MRVKSTSPVFTQKPILYICSERDDHKGVNTERLELVALHESQRAGCGCIPFFVRSLTTEQQEEVTETNDGAYTTHPQDENLNGYISLKGKLPIFKSDIERSYRSTWKERGERDFEKLELFINELTELLGEGKSKKNQIIDSLRGEGQAALQTLLEAYQDLTSAYFATVGKIGLQSDGDKALFQRKDYFQAIWNTLLKLSNHDFSIDDSKLLQEVSRTRPDQIDIVREKLNGRTSKVALALWISREKAKQKMALHSQTSL